MRTEHCRIVTRDEEDRTRYAVRRRLHGSSAHRWDHWEACPDVGVTINQRIVCRGTSRLVVQHAGTFLLEGELCDLASDVERNLLA